MTDHRARVILNALARAARKRQLRNYPTVDEATPLLLELTMDARADEVLGMFQVALDATWLDGYRRGRRRRRVAYLVH